MKAVGIGEFVGAKKKFPFMVFLVDIQSSVTDRMFQNFSGGTAMITSVVTCVRFHLYMVVSKELWDSKLHTLDKIIEKKPLNVKTPFEEGEKDPVRAMAKAQAEDDAAHAASLPSFTQT